MYSYRGEIIEGDFISFDFTDCDLTNAILRGRFIGCRFNATFYEADRRGLFLDCEVEQ